MAKAATKIMSEEDKTFDQQYHDHSNEAETGEITHEPQPTISQRALATVANAPAFKIKRQITRPLLKHHEGETVFLKFLSEPYYGKEIKGAKQEGIALLVNVRNMSTGATGEMVYILNSVLYSHKYADGKRVRTETDEDVTRVNTEIAEGKAKATGELFEAFPDGIIDREVAVNKYPKENGKRYNTFEVVEVEFEA